MYITIGLWIVSGDDLSVAAHSYKLAQATFVNFLSEAEKQGWTVSYALLGADEWRADWDIDGVVDKKSY